MENPRPTKKIRVADADADAGVTRDDFQLNPDTDIKGYRIATMFPKAVPTLTRNGHTP
jgi:hypothetical protein